MTIKIFLENVRASVFKDKITYETYPRTTHFAIGLIVLSSITFIAAITPKYGLFQSLFLSFMVGYGILWNLILLVPSATIQNAVAIVGGTFFLQKCKSSRAQESSAWCLRN
jgi:hypothetical protein